MRPWSALFCCMALPAPVVPGIGCWRIFRANAIARCRLTSLAMALSAAAPQVTAPKVAAPQVTALKAAAPQVTALKAAALLTTAYKAMPRG